MTGRTTMSTAEVVDRVLDEDWLSGLLGRAVRATRLRVKPDVAVIIALADTDSGLPAGWGRFLWPVSRSKAATARRRAELAGTWTREQELGGGLVVDSGPLAADPALVAHLHRAQSLRLLSALDPGRVLRYNPLRRLVVAESHSVVRVSSASQALARELGRCLRGLIPLPEETGVSAWYADAHISAGRRVGDMDLAGASGVGPRARAAAHMGAGELLAALHASTGGLSPGLRDRLATGRSDLHAQVSAHVGLLDLLAPDLAARLRRLLERLAGGAEGAVVGNGPGGPTGADQAVLTHGDASPDQVLMDSASGRLWLTDFERACLGPAADDLGSYLAECALPAGNLMLAGYERAGGALPRGGELGRAVTRSRLLRLVDPLRRADPLWREAIGASLSRLERGEP
ncbi:phosphotransferase family protein [Actinomyces oricola]|uniref:phosphotransferase family protein n=1 Tax=Actinomyces oricola TaxID=206043 RepID=UPI0013E8E133|nr:phosphotransferase [Actinomyces oricola]